MRIPEIRTEMFEIAMLLAKAGRGVLGERLAFLACETRRRVTGRRPNVSHPITPEMRQAIFEEWFSDPEAAMHTIAERLGINAGRVSETINGFRH